MELVDTHAHYHFKDFDADRNETIARARDAGVRFCINVGTCLKTSRQALALARTELGFYASVGVHPHEAMQYRDCDRKDWEALAREDRVVAVGEVGLDYYRNLSPPEVQRRVFSIACALAKEAGLPLILHVRDAFDDVMAILKKAFPDGYRGVFHCFSGDVAVMKEAVALGFHISLAGPVTYKKNDALREVAKEVPEDRIVVETDAPYLPPVPWRGKRNESAYMVETVRCIARVRDMPVDVLAQRTTDNARTLFTMEQ